AVTNPAVELLDVERRIALFAQAITGNAYEVRASDTHSGEAIGMRADRAALSSKALFLPARIDGGAGGIRNRRAYRLLALHQLGYREFGTFEFRLAAALERSAALRALAPNDPAAPIRDSDYDAFYRCFALPSLARALFRLIEAHRIDARMLGA